MRPADNPFRHTQVTQLTYILADTTWEDLLQRLAALNYRAAIVGPYGSGKTCLLRTLGARLQAQGATLKFLRLTEHAPTFPPGLLEALYADLSSQDIILFDEADQLSARAWHDFKHKTSVAKGIIITAHRRGRLPILTRCKPGPAVLSQIVMTLTGTELPNHAQRIAHLHRKHRGNLRAALNELYDLWMCAKLFPANEHAPDVEKRT